MYFFQQNYKINLALYFYILFEYFYKFDIYSLQCQPNKSNLYLIVLCLYMYDAGSKPHGLPCLSMKKIPISDMVLKQGHKTDEMVTNDTKMSLSCISKYL